MENTIKTLKTYINGRYYNIFEYNKDKLLKIIDFIKSRLENESKVGNGDLKNVLETLSVMFDSIVLRTLEEEDKEFIKSYNLLCYNLGMAYNLKNVLTRCEALSTLLEYGKSMVAQIEVSKRLMKLAEKYERFAPPIYEMNKSYLANIQERLNKV
jgi:hypothetical protein